MYRGFRAARGFRAGRTSRRFASTSASSVAISPKLNTVSIATAVAGTAAVLYYLYNRRPVVYAEIEAAPEVSETAAEAAFSLDGPDSTREGSFRWIDVTTDNFERILPQFQDLLAKSAFISIDTEFSGVTATRDQVPTYQDSAEEYYRKKASAIKNFCVFQVGICLWVPDPKTSALVAYPFNFYVFPRPYLHNRASIPSDAQTSFIEPSHNPVFSVQTGSMQFLSQHGFDFNTLVSKGITFMNGEKEKYFRDEYGFVKPPEGLRPKRPLKITSPEDKQFVENLISQVKQWQESCGAPESCPPLFIPKLNSFQRLVAFTELPKRFGADTLIMKTLRAENGSKTSNFEITLRTEAQKKEKQDALIAQNTQAFNKALGMRRVMKTIFSGNEESITGPPRVIVGHNMLLDLMYLYNCFHRDLPLDANEFKREIHKILPRIVDTKHVSTTDANLRRLLPTSTALDIVYQLAKQSSQFGGPEVRFDRSFGQAADHSDGSGFLHQAAYDAYITGYSFTKFMHMKEKQQEAVGDQSTEYYAERSKDFVNNLHLMFNRSRVLNVDGQKQKPDQSADTRQQRRWRK